MYILYVYIYIYIYYIYILHEPAQMFFSAVYLKVGNDSSCGLHMFVGSCGRSVLLGDGCYWYTTGCPEN